MNPKQLLRQGGKFMVKSRYWKTAGIGILAILSYFILPYLQAVPFQLLKVDTSTLPFSFKIGYMIAYESLMIGIFILLFYPKLKRDFKDMKQNHMTYYSTYFKYWILALLIMMASNLLIMKFTGNEVASNEQAIQSLFDQSPLYVFFSAVIFAPIVEELVFRQGIRNIITNKVLFIIISGLVFGGLHVISTDMTTLSELFYLIPYCVPGMVFAYILSETNNIFVSMGIHFMHNGLLTALQFLILFFS